MELGINLCGAGYTEGETLRLGGNCRFPTLDQIDYFAAQGMSVIRLPLVWKWLQPEAGGTLHPEYLSEMHAVVDYAKAIGVDVILDIHNTGYGDGALRDWSQAPMATFIDLWSRIASEFADDVNVRFGLMNEPLLPAVDWLETANAAINAIREVGATQQILVSGAYWSGAWSWVSSDNDTVIGANGSIVDPLRNFVFEVHQYLDDTSGTHDWVVSETYGADSLKAITAWARESGARLFLGEFGVANNQPSLEALDNMLAYMAENSDVWQGGTYWTAGHFMDDYIYTVNPSFGAFDQPQMDVLSKYIGLEVVETILENGGKLVETFQHGWNGPSVADVFDVTGKVISRTVFHKDGSQDRLAIVDADGFVTVTIFASDGGRISTIDYYSPNEEHLSQLTVAADGSSVQAVLDPSGNIIGRNHYTADGALLNTEKQLLDGSWQYETYEAGVLSSLGWTTDTQIIVERVDGHGHLFVRQEYDRSWQLKAQFHYANNGEVVQVYVFQDDGLIRSEHIVAGSNVRLVEIFSSTWQFQNRTIVGADGKGRTPDVFSTGDGTLIGGSGHDWLSGRSSSDNLQGGAGDDVLLGNDGNDILDGGPGADTLVGGMGDDTYVLLGATNDTIVEVAGGGIDTVTSTITRDLRNYSGVENLTLTFSAHVDGYGDEGANVITGNAGRNSLFGLGGNDTLIGGLGNDTLDGGDGLDTLIGGLGNDAYVLGDGHDVVVDEGGWDTITSSISRSLVDYPDIEILTLTGATNINATGNAWSNTLSGNDGDNILDGGPGADILQGGLGNDTYVLAAATNDTIYDVDGIDTITSTITRDLRTYSGVENLTLTFSGNVDGFGNKFTNVLTGNAGRNTLWGLDGDDVLFGMAGNDTLIGGLGNDTLDGGDGLDTLIGGLGNDAYVLGDGHDVVVDEGGWDTITSSISRSLVDYPDIEILTLTGAADINATGNAWSNTLSGNDGDNILDGGAGADTLIGGNGNDTYVLAAASNDTIIELAGGGSDTITSTISRDLKDFVNIENITLTFSANVNATGDAGANILVGNAGNNVLDGGAGNDVLDGGRGHDTLVGGAGCDLLSGGAGSDTFLFRSAADSTVNSMDRIVDFFSGEDRIDLSAIDANIQTAGHDRFTLLETGGTGFSGAAGELRWFHDTRAGTSSTIVELDYNGDAVADFAVQFDGAMLLSRDDFLL